MIHYRHGARSLTARLFPVVIALGARGERAAAHAAAPPATSDSQVIAIVPRPDSLTIGRGRFLIGPSTVIYTDPATADIARRFAVSLFPATGLSIPVRVGTPAGASAIVLERSARLTRLGDEGYELTVTPRRVTIRGRERAGLFAGHVEVADDFRLVLHGELLVARVRRPAEDIVPGADLELEPAFGVGLNTGE